jgi:UMF1 family MFS transporter
MVADAQASLPDEPQTPASRRGLFAWAMYDWANSAFPTVVVTFVFATYFAKGVVGDEHVGASYWGYAMGLSGLSIAILAPIFGAIADIGGRRKPWIAGCTAVCVAATALLTFIMPDPGYILPALILVAIANIGFEMGVVFNNAMLPDIVSKDRLGRLSGWAWGLGYVGGLGCLIVILTAFDLDSNAHVRATSLLVAVWFAVFSIPLFLWTPDQPSSGVPVGRAIRDGLALLGRTLRDVREHRVIVRFLIAHMIYGDGLVTLFTMGGVFAQSTYGMTTAEVLQFAVVINVTAGLGAAAFGWLDDRIGSKTTVLISLIALAAIGCAILTVDDKATFLILGAALGIFFGPAQAASRSLMARLVPQGKETEMFGLYALSGKATTFLGPLMFGLATAAFGSARAGMATILVFFVVGAVLLSTVPTPRR